ncbi:MAG: YhgE/Pip family protein [Actinomycetota bacterium]
MTLSIERARSRKPVTWLTLLGILLLPAAVGGILVAALNDPTERLDSMTAAIVNLDEPVTIDDQYTPLGRQLASGLVEGTDELDSNLTWVISNEDDAAEGIADGTYQAVITIPEEFSAAATSSGQVIADGEGDPEQATITITTPPDGRVADDLITGQIAEVAASTMGTMLSEATLENVLIGFTTIGDQIGEAADGATQLADGTMDAADGAAEIPDGATQLADGASQLGAGAGELGTGLDTIATGTDDAAAGANELGAGLASGADTVEQNGLIPTQLSEAAAGAAAATSGVSGGIEDVAGGLEQLAAACAGQEADPVCRGVLGLAAGMPELQEGADLAAQAAAGTSAGLAQFDTEASEEFAAQFREAADGASALGSGLTQLSDGVSQSANGARELSSGAGELSTGAGELATGAEELVEGLDELGAGTEDLADGLHTASDSLPSFSDEESSTLASVVADPVTSNASNSSIFGPTAIPLLTAVVLWFGALASFIAMRAVTARTLTSRRSSATLTLRAFTPAAVIGAGQGLLVALIVQIIAQYDAGAWWSFAGIAVLASIAFAAVNQALVALLGGIGRWVSALIGVLAVATGLISTVPGWLAGLGDMLPTAPAFAGLIEGSGSTVAALVVWGVLALLATTLAVAVRRTTSTKAVLATA